MRVHKLTGMIGAELAGVDLSRPIDEPTAQSLRASLAEHLVIVLRGQYLSLAAQKRLTRVFGEVMRLPYVEPLADDSEVIAVLKEAGERNTGVFGGEWHSDFSFLAKPPAGSVLSAMEVPDVGGDTTWASQVAAYASLPPELKSVVDGRRAVHVGAPYGVKHAPPQASRAGASVKMTRGDPQADREMLHPAVLVAPNGKQRSLYLNPIYTTRFEDMTKAQSAPILAAIYKHCTRPDFSCRVRWQAGDVVIWDNRATLHYASNDYDGHRRLLYRTTFGDARAGPNVSL